MLIGLASLHDPDYSRSWSGSVHHMVAALRRKHRVVWLGPPSAATERRHFRLRLRRRLARYLPGNRTVTVHDEIYARRLARDFDARARALEPDVLFAPAGSIGVGDMAYRAPLVYLSDATFDLMLGYYPEFARLDSRNRRAGEALEQSAIDRADQSLFASEWAVGNAVGHYHADPARTGWLPFGANIDHAPDPAGLKYGRDDRLRLVFIGIDWARKGGDIAVDALKNLRARGLPATLTVIGCTPPPGHPEVEGLTVIPFLHKNKPDDARRFAALLTEADFHLLPTRFEAIGVVYCEASAFAVPSLATDTGGVASHVENGVNGFRLPPEAGGDAYAERIAAIWTDAAGFASLRRSSRAKYDRDLNWDVWVERFEPILHAAIDHFAGTR